MADSGLDEGDLYLDFNATAPLARAAAEAMKAALEQRLVNPASSHRAGERSARVLEAARAEVAALVGAAPEEVVFTSGATEANHLALFGLIGPPVSGRRVGPPPSGRGVAPPRRGRGIVVSAIEHSSLLDATRLLEELGAAATRVAPAANGVVAVAPLLAAVRPETALVALMHANNETGVLQPVEAAARALAERGVAFHVDAAQSAGRVALDWNALAATTLSLTAHKLGGPPGVGALIVRRGTRLVPLIRGGRQERGRRGGTPNLLGIIGFAAAAKAARARGRGDASVRDEFERRLLAQIPLVRIQGSGAPRIPNTSSVTFTGGDGSRILAELSRRGVHASAGSACQAGAPEPSHVLRAMGLPAADVRATVRFSFGPDADLAQAERAVAAVVAALASAAGARAD
jgi:cysteine desulfurase